VPGLGTEAALAAGAIAVGAYAMSSEATQAMPMATEALPPGYGDDAPPSDPLGLPPGEDGTEPPKKNRAPAFVLLGLAAIAAIVLLLVFGPKLFGSDNQVAHVTVPPVTQMTLADATAKLSGLGLKTVATSAPDDTVPKGQVSTQDPAAGTSVDAGATVNLTVSTGPNTVQVPDVSGLNQDDATARLQAAGLTVSTADTVPSAAQAAGQVLDTDPAAGKTVNKGTPVALHLASGSATVPNVVGQDNLTAAQNLSAAGFKVKQVLAPSDKPQNQVIAQDHAGDVLKRGQTVTLTVSTGTPSPTTTTTAPTGTPTGTPTG
jgi:eukaryotic-like serine/threonine-protein kinase